jgi:hypothetical protein
MTRTACHFPITVVISGDPAGVDLEELGRAVEAALVNRLRLARDQFAVGAAVTVPGAAPAAASGEAGLTATYAVPSYVGRGVKQRLAVHRTRQRPGTAIVTVRWQEYFEDFYGLLVQAIATRFGVPEAGLFQPVWVPAHRFHREHDMPAGRLVRIEVGLDWHADSPAGTVVQLRLPIDPAASAAPARPGSQRAKPPPPPPVQPTARPSAEPLAQPGQAAPPRPWAGGEGEGTYPSDVALFSTFLIRNGYIERVSGLIGPAWRSMSEAELTAHLSQRFSERQLQEMFLEKYAERATIKAQFRKLSIVSALVVGLIWARENLAQGEWGPAIAKVGGSAITAWLFNRLLYARDPAAAALMARAPGNFGKWFQGAARSNRAVNFLVRDVARGLLLWDLKDIFMSGGYGGPNIPFDIIYTVDIDDPATWEEPSQVMLDLGFNIWYRQKETPNHPEAAGGNLYLAKVEGSAVTGLLKVLDIAPRQVPGLRDRLFQVVGPWHEISLVITTYSSRTVREEEKVFVLATGKRSGELGSARGHYRSLEVVPANEPAVKLFAGVAVEFVPEYLLRPVLR